MPRDAAVSPFRKQLAENRPISELSERRVPSIGRRWALDPGTDEAIAWQDQGAPSAVEGSAREQGTGSIAVPWRVQRRKERARFETEKGQQGNEHGHRRGYPSWCRAQKLWLESNMYPPRVPRPHRDCDHNVLPIAGRRVLGWLRGWLTRRDGDGRLFKRRLPRCCPLGLSTPRPDLDSDQRSSVSQFGRAMSRFAPPVRSPLGTNALVSSRTLCAWVVKRWTECLSGSTEGSPRVGETGPRTNFQSVSRELRSVVEEPWGKNKIARGCCPTRRRAQRAQLGSREARGRDEPRQTSMPNILPPPPRNKAPRYRGIISLARLSSQSVHPIPSVTFRLFLFASLVRPLSIVRRPSSLESCWCHPRPPL